MKDKVLMLVIGILIGAIVTSAYFLLFAKNNNYPKERMNGKDFNANMIDGDMRRSPRDRDGNNIGEPPANPIDNNSELSEGAYRRNT